MCSVKLLKYLTDGQPIEIDPETEDVIPLKKAGLLPLLREPDGRSTHIGTLRRWARKGRGPLHVRLETLQTGRDMYTSKQAVVRFSQRLAESMREPLGAPGQKGSTQGVEEATPIEEGSLRPIGGQTQIMPPAARTSAASTFLDGAGLRRRPRRATDASEAA